MRWCEWPNGSGIKTIHPKAGVERWPSCHPRPAVGAHECGVGSPRRQGTLLGYGVHDEPFPDLILQVSKKGVQGDEPFPDLIFRRKLEVGKKRECKDQRDDVGGRDIRNIRCIPRDPTCTARRQRSFPDWAHAVLVPTGRSDD